MVHKGLTQRGVLNTGIIRAESFNRDRINLITDAIQTVRPNQRNETVVVEIGDCELMDAGIVVPGVGAGVPATANAGVPTAQQDFVRNQVNQGQLDRQDRERREKNLIVTGIYETNHEGDWEAVHQMLNYLRSQHRERQIVRLVRLGKNEEMEIT